MQSNENSILYIDGLAQERTPLLTHWSYVFLALTHRYKLCIHNLCIGTIISSHRQDQTKPSSQLMNQMGAHLGFIYKAVDGIG